MANQSTETSVHSIENDTALPTIELRRIASIQRAPLFKSDHSGAYQSVGVVSIKDFPTAGYIVDAARRIDVDQDDERIRQFFLEPYDVLVTIVGTIGKVTIVSPQLQDRWVAATNMLRIRFIENRQHHAIALYGFFKSPVGSAVLDRLTHGRAIPLISKKEFARIRIPELSPTVAEKTMDLWEQENALYTESMKKLEASQSVFDDYSFDVEERSVG